jgi:hypothetical protein
VLSNSADSTRIKQILDFLNDTLFINFDLYKYVFTYEREVMEKNEEKQISCPAVQDTNLSSAKPDHIWNYENKLNIIEKKEKNMNNMFLDRRWRLVQEEESMKRNKLIDNLDDLNFDEDSLSKLIDSIAEPFLKTTMSLIKNEAEEVRENILVNLEKSSIPRPEELGKRK